MQSTFDERNWLAWLVKVRILILTFLLAIQLAVAYLTPAPLPVRLFVSTILLWSKQCDFASYSCDFSLAPAFVRSF